MTQARRRPATPQKPYYRACKTIRVAGLDGRPKVYRRGQVVPEAKTWPRIESWVNARHVELVE